MHGGLSASTGSGRPSNWHRPTPPAIWRGSPRRRPAQNCSRPAAGATSGGYAWTVHRAWQTETMTRILLRSGKDPFTPVVAEATLQQDVFNSNSGNYPVSYTHLTL